MTTLAVHDGRFHADDVLATALVVAAYPDVRVVRSRDPALLAGADLVLDVGAVFDPDRGRFDHHLPEPPRREDGVPYSSFGLVWMHLGTGAVRALVPEATDEEAWFAWSSLDKSLVRDIDMADNGLVDGGSDLSWTIEAMAVPLALGEDLDSLFDEAVAWAGQLLRRVARRAVDGARGRGVVDAAVAAALDARIIVLDEAVPWKGAFRNGRHPAALYVVHPDHSGDAWLVVGVPSDGETPTLRKPFPEAWAGLREVALASLTGVDDAVFCHHARFVCGAASREGALALARLAAEAA